MCVAIATAMLTMPWERFATTWAHMSGVGTVGTSVMGQVSGGCGVASWISTASPRVGVRQKALLVVIAASKVMARMLLVVIS